MSNGICLPNPLSAEPLKSTRRCRSARTIGAAVAIATLTTIALWVSTAIGKETNKPDHVDPQLVNAIIQRLEASGQLDEAVSRALNRIAERRRAESQAASAKRLKALREEAKKARPVMPGHDHIRGNEDAEVSLIEYADFECPFCKRFHGAPAKAMELFGGKVNWVYRIYPLSFHGEKATTEAYAAECAASLGGNTVFWRYADALFENTRSNGRGLPGQTPLLTLAKREGIDEQRFANCIKDPKTAERIAADVKDANAIHISGTPTTIVRNNRTGAVRLLVGAKSVTAIEAAVNQVLASDNVKR